jgi:hypothetical protein
MTGSRPAVRFSAGSLAIDPPFGFPARRLRDVAPCKIYEHRVKQLTAHDGRSR